MMTAACPGEGIKEVIEKLGYRVIPAQEDDIQKVTLKVAGMTCAACSARIEKSLTPWKGCRRRRKSDHRKSHGRVCSRPDQSG